MFIYLVSFGVSEILIDIKMKAKVSQIVLLSLYHQQASKKIKCLNEMNDYR